MKSINRHILFAFAAVAVTCNAQSSKLTGDVIGTEYSVNFSTGGRSTTVNTKDMAFDGNPSTYFASYDKSFTWLGYDLGSKHVITKVGYMSRDDFNGPASVTLGVFEGANEPDFSDAMPIYLIRDKGERRNMLYGDVSCTRGFRYVRYVGPHDARCQMAELEFYGFESEGNDDCLFQLTNLPLVVVNTPNMEWFRDYDKKYPMEGSQVYVINDNKIDTQGKAQIRGRGNGSWTFPKKPFRIKFDKKQKVLGGPAKAKKWAMINNYGDKTLMRNMLAFEMSRRIGMDFTPVCHPVDVIFNGEYQGNYQLCDQIEVNANRVNITEMEPTDIEDEALTGGYLIEIDAYAESEPDGGWFYSQGGHSIPVTIQSPDPGVTQQYEYIRDKFTKLEQAVYGSNYGDPQLGYRALLDEDSFLKHFIVGELAGNTDTYWSVYMTLDRGADKFVTGPCWDFDLGFENDNRTYPVNSHNDFVCFAAGSWVNGMKSFVQRIIKYGRGSKDRLQWLWSDARVNRGFNYDEFEQIVDEYYDLLYESQELNFKRWNIMNTKVHQNPRIWGSYDAEVLNVKNYLNLRFDKLDKLIGRVPVEGISDVDVQVAQVSVNGSMLDIAGAESYVVSNMQGVVVASGKGGVSLRLAPGVYVVRTDGATRKVAIY